MADQEDLATEWGEALTEQGAKPKGAAAGNDDDMAAQWAAMIEDGDRTGAERLLEAYLGDAERQLLESAPAT